MARGRMLSKSIATDHKLSTLGEDALLAFLHVIPHLDRDGLIDGRPVVLWATAMPTRPRYMDLFPSLIDQWIVAGLAQRYHVAEDLAQPVLFFPGFRKNQEGMRYSREAASTWPPPPGTVRDETGIIAPDLLRSNSGNCPVEDQDQDKDQVKDQDQLTDSRPVGRFSVAEDLLAEFDPDDVARALAIADEYKAKHRVRYAAGILLNWRDDCRAVSAQNGYANSFAEYDAINLGADHADD